MFAPVLVGLVDGADDPRVSGWCAGRKLTGIAITMSLGLSAGRGEQVEYEALFKAADGALYEAKRRGRNLVRAAPARTLDLSPPAPRCSS